MDDAIKSPGAYPLEAAERINLAYAKACDIAGSHSGSDELRSRLAERILFLARNGETDEDRLCSLAVIAVLGRPPNREDGSSRVEARDFRVGMMPPAAAPGATEKATT